MPAASSLVGDGKDSVVNTPTKCKASIVTSFDTAAAAAAAATQTPASASESVATTFSTPTSTLPPSFPDGETTLTTTNKMKKKARYSKQEKRDRKERQQQQQGIPTTEITKQQQPQQQASSSSSSSPAPPPPQPPPPPKLPMWQERIFRCVQVAQSIDRHSVVVDEGPNENNCNSNSNRGTTIRLVTSTNWESSRRWAPPLTTTTTTIRVKPLLILDLNGVLCHRSRTHKEPPGVQLRQPFLGNVAGTPVVGRTDLSDLLPMVDRHFTLAVWTSAKQKTARLLLRLLFPHDIQKRLLFVWAQDRCRPVEKQKNQATISQQCNTNNGGSYYYDHDVIYEKRLDQVWREFPLWNANNTLLMDDSPDKCPLCSDNTIHPPPLHGQRCPPIPQYPLVIAAAPNNNNNNTMIATTNYYQQSLLQQQSWIPDEPNEVLQFEFLQRYHMFWQERPYVEYLTEDTTVPMTMTTPLLPSSRTTKTTTTTKDPRKKNDVGVAVPAPVIRGETIMTNRSLYEFLSQYGAGHMGWRGGS